MKRKVILLVAASIIVIFISACGKEQKDDDIVRYESGNYYDKNWDEPVGTYTGAVIPDQETALEIAKAVYNGMEKNKKEQEYVQQFVFYDEQDEVWIVSFGENSDEIIAGGGCSIAMRKSDGKVLRIWFGE